MKSITRFLLFLLLLFIVLAGASFIYNNNAETSLWLGVELQPRAIGLWVLLAFICGGAFGLLLGYGLWDKMQSKLHLKIMQNRLRQGQDEIARLQRKLKVLETGTRTES